MLSRSLYALIYCIALSGALMLSGSARSSEAAFPKSQPSRASFQRPALGEILDISPPGFSWWRAGQRGEVRYRLKIHDASDTLIYTSDLLEDPIHVPDKVLAAGIYTWLVEAVDSTDAVVDTRAPFRFQIAEYAVEQPWMQAKALLSRVPQHHPRLLFPKAQLEEIRSTLTSSRKEAFRTIQARAKHALSFPIPDEPAYDEEPTRADQRLAYFKSFGQMRQYHDNGMVPLALTYLMTGEEQYGRKAKDLLLGAAAWDPDGISSILSPYGDEIGLGLCKAAAHTYDWIYDLLNAEERKLVETMLVARGDQMLRRLQKQDYPAKPAGSHNGRLPGYMLEYAIALAEHPRAEVWMDYALPILMTCHPHWGGKDGGWAEGIHYGLAYNTMSAIPFESLRQATGFSLWDRPFHRKLRYFFLYNAIPQADIAPFGDSEHLSATRNPARLRSLLLFHANRYKDPVIRWWADQLRDQNGNLPAPTGLMSMLAPDMVTPGCPNALANDAAFFGVGWAALHSNILEPENNVAVLFKSSPYGGISHSHADQNSFVIFKNGKSLAIPAGARYPHHGSPFHTQYTQLTMAHNAVLINGRGQANRDTTRGGKLTDIQSTRHLGYVCGDARNCFRRGVRCNRRHMLLIRPSIVIVVDDLHTTDVSTFQWLLHNHTQFELDESAQTILSRKDSEAMTVHLLTPGGFFLEQTDEWPLDPKTGYPNATQQPPEKQWHLTASACIPAEKRRIAAIMFIHENGEAPDYQINQSADFHIEVMATLKDGVTTTTINLNTLEKNGDPIIESVFLPFMGSEEKISVR